MMYDWIIHIVADENVLPGMVDAHTHGLNKYNHPEIQFVLAYPAEYIGAVINEIGERISAGEVFKNGDTFNVKVLSCDLKVFTTTDSEGKNILRIIIPDGKLNWPTDSQEYPYNMQLETPYKDCCE